MKLSNIVRIWDAINYMDLGELRYHDLENAVANVVGVKNDVPTDVCDFERPGNSDGIPLEHQLLDSRGTAKEYAT